MIAFQMAGLAERVVPAVRAQSSPDGQRVIAAEVRERETGWEGDHLTGDWGGWRDRMVERGIHLQAGYVGEILGNVSGGLRRGAIFEGLLELGIDFDSEKLGLWNGGTLHSSALFPHGSPFSTKYVGDILTASNIEAYESFRLYELWYEQRFLEDQFSVRLGQLVADDEFAFTDSGGLFINSAFGWPAFISGNTVNTGPAFHVATPGVRLRYEAAEELYLQAGIFDGDSFDSPLGDPRVNASGTRIHLNHDQGAFAIAETGWRLNHGENSQGLPGEYKLGAWLHTGNFPSNYDDRDGKPIVVTGGDPEMHSENFGIYAAVQQMIWREESQSEEGLSGFLRAGLSPADRSLFEFVVDGGFTYRGLLPARPEDQIGIGTVYARVSRDVRESEQLDASVNGTSYAGYSNHETVLELFYSLQLTPWWIVQPDVQWIFNPGGRAGSDALVLGLRTALVF